MTLLTRCQRFFDGLSQHASHDVIPSVEMDTPWRFVGARSGVTFNFYRMKWHIRLSIPDQNVAV